MYMKIIDYIYTSKELYLKCIYSKGELFNGFIVGKEYKVLSSPAVLEGGKIVYNIEDSQGYSWTIDRENSHVKFKLVERDKEE